MTEPATYPERAERAARLAGERPWAAEILALYRRMLEHQQPLFERVVADGWAVPPGMAEGDGEAGQDTAPGLGLDRLQFGALDRPFVRFVDRLGAVANETLAAVGRALVEAPAERRTELLRATARLEAVDEAAEALGVEPLPALFFARGFLQPVAEGLAHRKPVGFDPESGGESTCPRCGWPPQVGLLQDRAERRGERRLVCGLCATAWPFPRARCPACGETGAERRTIHEPEETPHVRIEACASCEVYLKSIDLRTDGLAVPLVEDLATPELDLWADEKGLKKTCRNLFGV